MYWIYLIIFAFMVSSPSIINRDFYFINEEIAENILIFIFGGTGFIIFLLAEKRFKLNFSKRIVLQKEAKDASRDLTETYSYIGEMNRKMEVLKGISSCVPEINPDFFDRDKNVLRPIFEAISLFGKTSDFIIRIVDTEKNKIIREIKRGKKVPFIINEDFIKLVKKNSIIDEKKYIIFSSAKGLEELFASIIIYKKNEKSNISDPEIMKIIAGKVLCLFAYSQIKSSLNKTEN